MGLAAPSGVDARLVCTLTNSTDVGGSLSASLLPRQGARPPPAHPVAGVPLALPIPLWGTYGLRTHQGGRHG